MLLTQRVAPEFGMMTGQTPFPQLAGALRQTVDVVLSGLRAMSSSHAAQPWSPGKWSPQQIIGHLVDSAANNHQRFVRAQEGASLAFPAYTQEHWVRCQHYEDCPWDDLVSFWHAYNRHLAHVMARIPEDLRDVQCAVGTDPPVTLGFLAHDYLVHLRHHLTQDSRPALTRLLGL